MVHLPGQKAEMAARQEFPEGAEGAAFPALTPGREACAPARGAGSAPAPGQCRGCVTVTTQFVKEMLTGRDKHSGGVFAVSQQVLV